MNQLKGLLFLYMAIILFNCIFNAALWLKTRAKHYQIQSMACLTLGLTVIAQALTADESYLDRAIAASTTFLGVLSFTKLLTSMVGIPLRARFFVGVYCTGFITTLLLYWMGVDINWVTFPVLIGAAFPMIWEGIRAFLFRREKLSFVTRCFIVSAIITGLHLLDYAYAIDKPEYMILGFTLAMIGVFAMTTFSTAVALEAVTGESMRHRMEMEFRARLLNSEKLLSLGEMAGGIAHEINNPLTVIQLYTEKLKSELDGPTIDHHSVIKTSEVISRTVNRIAKVILGLRNFARDASTDPLVETSLKDILDGVLTFCEERFQEHGVVIHRQEFGDTKVICRPTEVSQALLNLLTNAFDSVQKISGPRQIWIQTKRDGKFVNLVISDNGPTIPSELRSKVFDPFFTTKGMGSAGLGLSVSQGILQSQGGSLKLDYATAHTSFIAQLPMV